MQTTIVIKHDTAEALTRSPLWTVIKDLFLSDGPVSVIQIADTDDEQEE